MRTLSPKLMMRRMQQLSLVMEHQKPRNGALANVEMTWKIWCLLTKLCLSFLPQPSSLVRLECPVSTTANVKPPKVKASTNACWRNQKWRCPVHTTQPKWQLWQHIFIINSWRFASNVIYVRREATHPPPSLHLKTIHKNESAVWFEPTPLLEGNTAKITNQILAENLQEIKNISSEPTEESQDD